MKPIGYRRILSVILLVCMLAFGVSLTAIAQTPEIDDKDPSAGAPDPGDYLVMKVNPAMNGTWTSLDGLLTVEITDLDGDSLCWSSDIPVHMVFLKAGAGGDVLVYDPPSTGPHCVSTTSGHDISHITFYY